MIMEFVQDEPHAYTSAQVEYRFGKRDQSNYEILYVRGFKVLDSGSVNHVFIQGVDYELRNQCVYWLDGDRPSVPPPSSNLTQNWFYITYVYEKRPEQTIQSSVYPFLKPNGVFTSILDAFGSQIRHVYEKRRGMVRSRSLSYSLGAELDMLGIINVRVISKGRGGRMREIKLAITKNIIEKAKEIIKDSLSYS